MNFLNLIKILLYGVIEGITEWLPISSTGHLILLERFLNFNMSHSFMEMFRVVIQFGAILAVIILYFNDLNIFTKNKSKRCKTISLWIKIIVSCIPAGIIGILLDDVFDKYLYNHITVCIALIVYGILFIILEKRKMSCNFKVTSVDSLDMITCLKLGLFQSLALIPGTSRSGATITGGMILNVKRDVTCKFAFFMAIPVMLGASLVKLVKFGFTFQKIEIVVLLIGCLTSLLVSIFAIKFLINYVKKHNFVSFGFYRIILGVIILLYFL